MHRILLVLVFSVASYSNHLRSDERPPMLRMYVSEAALPFATEIATPQSQRKLKQIKESFAQTAQVFFKEKGTLEKPIEITPIPRVFPPELKIENLGSHTFRISVRPQRNDADLAESIAAGPASIGMIEVNSNGTQVMDVRRNKFVPLPIELKKRVFQVGEKHFALIWNPEKAAKSLWELQTKPTQAQIQEADSTVAKITKYFAVGITLSNDSATLNLLHSTLTKGSH